MHQVVELACWPSQLRLCLGHADDDLAAGALVGVGEQCEALVCILEALEHRVDHLSWEMMEHESKRMLTPHHQKG